jgi:hypothetical protein
VGIEDLSLKDLRALYISMEQRYLSAGERVEHLEAQVLTLKTQNAILGAEKAQWEVSRDLNNGMIQQQLATMDAEKQEMAQIITDLRARLREDE